MCSILFAGDLACGVQHGFHTNDFPTYCLRLQARNCAPLIMQAAGYEDLEAEVARFVGAGRDVQLAMLHEALKRGIDRPLVVPVPHTHMPLLAFSPLILTVAGEPGQLDSDHVLALCNLAHIPVLQDPGFVFRHDSMDDDACAWVMLVVPRAVPPVLQTWRYWVASHVSPLDAHFGLNASVTATLGEFTDFLLRCTYDEEDDAESHIRLFLHRTHFAAHFAYAYIHNMMAAQWLADKSQFKMLPFMRAMMLSRMLISWDWSHLESQLPDFKPQKFVLISGIPYRTCALAMPRQTNLEQFTREMRLLQSAGT